MTESNADRRRKERRVYAWGIGAAVVLHLVAFFLMPSFRSDPPTDPSFEAQWGAAPAGAPVVVDLLFGPPTITGVDGVPRTEPPERLLEADRLVLMPDDCVALAAQRRAPFTGSVQLLVKASGRVDVLGVVESTGAACVDAVIRTVAGDLWYHWLPDDRFPPPVRVIQPMSLTAAVDA
jgi:hypothetical protein